MLKMSDEKAKLFPLVSINLKFITQMPNQRRHDTQYNDIQHNDTQFNIISHANSSNAKLSYVVHAKCRKQAVVATRF